MASLPCVRSPGELAGKLSRRVDRLPDMSRTAVNVAGDMAACVVTERFPADPDSRPAVEAAAGET